MKFAIGYGFGENDDLDSDTLLMGENGIVNQLDIHCPELPEPYKAERIIHVVDENMQASISIIEIDSLEQLLDLSRKLGRDLTLERQPQGMLDTVGATLPEFSIIINDAYTE